LGAFSRSSVLRLVDTRGSAFCASLSGIKRRPLSQYTTSCNVAARPTPRPGVALRRALAFTPEQKSDDAGFQGDERLRIFEDRSSSGEEYY
jgi:hypothetical protein